MSNAKEPLATKSFFSRNWSYLRWPEPLYMRVAYVFAGRSKTVPVMERLAEVQLCDGQEE